MKNQLRLDPDQDDVLESSHRKSSEGLGFRQEKPSQKQVLELDSCQTMHFLPWNKHQTRRYHQHLKYDIFQSSQNQNQIKNKLTRHRCIHLRKFDVPEVQDQTWLAVVSRDLPVLTVGIKILAEQFLNLIEQEAKVGVTTENLDHRLT